MPRAALTALAVAAAIVLLGCPAAEGLPHMGPDTNEVVPETATGDAQGATLVSFHDPDHSIAEDPTDPYEETKDPMSAAMDKDDNPMTIESKIPGKADQWEKFAVRHENEAEMDPTADDEHLDKNWGHDLNEPHARDEKISVPMKDLLPGMSKVCVHLGEHLCADGSCSAHCATMQADTARPFTVDPQDHQPEMEKAVFNIHHHAHFRMSTENGDKIDKNAKMPPPKGGEVVCDGLAKECVQVVSEKQILEHHLLADKQKEQAKTLEKMEGDKPKFTRSEIKSRQGLPKLQRSKLKYKKTRESAHPWTKPVKEVKQTYNSPVASITKRILADPTKPSIKPAKPTAEKKPAKPTGKKKPAKPTGKKKL